MKWRKVISERIRHQKDGVNVVGDVNAVLSGNVNERNSVSSVSSKQRIVQRSGRSARSEASTSETDRSKDN